MKKKLLVLMVIFVMFIGLMPASNIFAGTTNPITNDSMAAITINNAVEGDTFAAYKVVDITYNGTSNNLTHKFNSSFTEYFNGTYTPAVNKTIEQFAALADNSDDLKELLSNLPAYITAKSISPVATQTVAQGNTSVTFSNLAMGEYFIIPTSTTSVYQLMLQKVEPTVSGSNYALSDVTISAKHKEVNISKEADKTSVTKGETVIYTITVDIPTYDLSATNKTFSIVDTLQSGLTLKDGSISAKFSDDAIPVSGKYSLSNTASGFTFSVDNDKYDATWKAKAEGLVKLIITYKATLDNNINSDSIITSYDNKIKNEVIYTYSTYPYKGDTATKKSEKDVNSFIIKVVKYDANAVGTKLAGAKFDLYRTLRSGETATTVDIPGTATLLESEKRGIKLESGLTTDGNGVIEFKKYEANGVDSAAAYDYYLVETEAPVGYNLLQEAVKVNFAEANVSGSNGVYTVNIPNSTGFQLPITGGTGTVLMSLIGIALMACAVVLLVVSRKKKENKEQQ